MTQKSFSAYPKIPKSFFSKFIEFYIKSRTSIPSGGVIGICQCAMWNLQGVTAFHHTVRVDMAKGPGLAAHMIRRPLWVSRRVRISVLMLPPPVVLPLRPGKPWSAHVRGGGEKV